MWGVVVSAVYGSLNSLVNVGIKYVLTIILPVVMVCLLFSNIYGLLIEVFSMWYPYVFMFSVFGWFVIVLDDVLFSGNFLSHFVPTGVTLGMGMILSFLELISYIIRPVTLCVRLSTNITAGHVIMHIISLFCYSSWVVVVGLGLFVMFVVVLEVVVCVLQSYIFSSLLELYHSEFV